MAGGSAAVSDDYIALYDDHTVHVWHRSGNALDGGWSYTVPHILDVVLSENTAYVQTVQGLVAVHHGDPGTFEPIFGLLKPTAHGFLQLTSDGGLRVHDEWGWTRIQRKSSGVRHADVSPDNRYLVATTDAGETLEWDLHAAAPVRIKIGPTWLPAGISDRAVWVESPADGVARVDLRTGVSELAIARQATDYTLVDFDERWVAAGTFTASHLLYIADRTTGKRIAVPDIAIAVNDSVGVTTSQLDGTISRWRVGDDAPQRLASFNGNVEILTAARDQIAALAGDELLRLDPATRRIERIPAPPGVDGMQITAGGQVWILARHVVWGWSVGAFALVRVPTADPIDEIFATNDQLVMTAAREITVIVDGVTTVTPMQAGVPMYIDERRAVVRSDRNELSMIDLHSGFSFTFSSPAVIENVCATHDRVAAVTRISEVGSTLTIWNVDVPDEPLALEAWLGTITNAQRIGNSEVYTWP